MAGVAARMTSPLSGESCERGVPVLCLMVPPVVRLGWNFPRDPAEPLCHVRQIFFFAPWCFGLRNKRCQASHNWSLGSWDWFNASLMAFVALVLWSFWKRSRVERPALNAESKAFSNEATAFSTFALGLSAASSCPERLVKHKARPQRVRSECLNAIRLRDELKLWYKCRLTLDLLSERFFDMHGHISKLNG